MQIPHTTNSFGQPVGSPLPDWQPPPAPAREPLEGRYCRVEPLQPERHARALYEANSLDAEGRNWTYLPYGPFEDFESYQEWLATSAALDDPLFYAIVDKGSEKAVGVASYLRIDPRNGVIEIGHLHFSARLQQRPAATEALFLLLDNVFRLGYRRCEWKCDALNAPSRRAARRLGFSFEGLFRQATIYKGRNRDTAWYAIIDREWPALQRAFTQWLAPENFDAEGRQRTALSTLTAPLLQPSGRELPLP